MKSRILFSLALLIAASTTASAAGLNGSFGFTGLNATKNGTNLSNTTIFTFTNYLVTSNGAGDFSGVTTGTFFNGPNPPAVTGVLDVTSPATMAGFSITNPSFGTFVASNSAFNMILSQTTNFMDVQLVGMFTPAGSLSGFSPTPADVRVSINLSGSSVSAAFTLTSPTNVPEPSTYALGMVSTLVLGACARRRRRKVQATS
ncbi:PEP-CTERM sorting domain-containing protein [bacterium]|nr:PEP-CTERM sorting domain-containing protein [bacterium]